ARQAIGLVRTEAVQWIRGEQEKANVVEGIAGGSQEVQEVAGAPAIPDPVLDPLDLVDDDQQPPIGADLIELLEPAQTVAPAIRLGRRQAGPS
ncbi:MAG TPA: hypothetical protein VK607_13870, partial [Kofleriaceae bacterium]|nr:hypothetical protein [Kofleriaceae bacterium]